MKGNDTYFIAPVEDSSESQGFRDSVWIPQERLPIAKRVKKIGKVVKQYDGKIIGVEANLFTAEIYDGSDTYRMRVKKTMLREGQADQLAIGADIQWIVRHDYRKARKTTRAEIVFQKRYQISDATLRRLMDESAAKFGHMFRDED